MKRRVTACIAAFVFFLVSSGCSPEVISRKFIRKKKKPQEAAVYNVRPYEQPPNADMYANAFIFWKTWASELLMNMEQRGYAAMRNELKLAECSRQALANLGQMRKILNEQKGAELDIYIERMRQMDEKIKAANLTFTQTSRLRNDIERHKRAVQRDFCLEAVKDELRPDPPKREKIDTAEESPVFLEKKPRSGKKRTARPTEGYYPKPF